MEVSGHWAPRVYQAERRGAAKPGTACLCASREGRRFVGGSFLCEEPSHNLRRGSAFLILFHIWGFDAHLGTEGRPLPPPVPALPDSLLWRGLGADPRSLTWVPECAQRPAAAIETVGVPDQAGGPATSRGAESFNAGGLPGHRSLAALSPSWHYRHSPSPPGEPAPPPLTPEASRPCLCS